MLTYVEVPNKEDPATGEIVELGGSMRKRATVFHITQTEEVLTEQLQ